MIYLDTSWLVKLYVDEGDSDVVRGLVAGDPAVLLSELSYVEFHSAVARGRRRGSLSATVANPVVERFRRDWATRRRIAVTHEVVARAADLVGTHPLRSLDALHLASALVVAAGAPEPLRFGASDNRLVAAAQAEGLEALS